MIFFELLFYLLVSVLISFCISHIVDSLFLIKDLNKIFKEFKMKKSELLNIRRSLTKVAQVVQELKSLPNCYSCSKSDCPYRLVDDSAPSRYNCPLYVRDPDRELVENI